MTDPMVIPSTEVADALATGTPVVALESTVFSNLGLPSPANAEALWRCLAAVRSGGAIPAVTAIVDGTPRLGLDEHEYQSILTCTAKTASRDLPLAVAERLPVGVTTVSASLAIAHAGGVEVFATGGIGGVHRGAEATGDVSADLPALAAHPVVCVSAGAKAFLDLARTLELLETLGVPVLGWHTDEFPAFYLRTSGLPVRRVDDAATVARAMRASRALGRPQGVLVTPPLPEADALDDALVRAAIDEAHREARAAGATGPAVTPFILDHISAATDGQSIPANLALAEHNASVGAAIAVALAAVG